MMNQSGEFNLRKWREFIITEDYSRIGSQDKALLSQVKGKVSDEELQGYMDDLLPYSKLGDFGREKVRQKLKTIINPLPPSVSLDSFPELKEIDGKYKLNNVSDLTFDILRATFPTNYQSPKYYNKDFGWDFSDAALGEKGDASALLSSEIQVERYRNFIIDRYGDVPVILNPNGPNNRGVISPISDKLTRASATASAGAADYYARKKPGEYQGD
jgi:hypothetical protein